MVCGRKSRGKPAGKGRARLGRRNQFTTTAVQSEKEQEDERRNGE